jgi:hypothetical protein
MITDERSTFATGESAYGYDSDVSDEGGDSVPRYFGFDDSSAAHANPSALSPDGLVCMVFQIGAEHLTEVQHLASKPLTPDDWVVSTGAHEATVVHGPFRELEDAFEFGRSTVGATRYLSEPELT